ASLRRQGTPKKYLKVALHEATFPVSMVVQSLPLYLKTMSFFEVTGGLRLDSVLEGPPSRKGEPPARREG
ncbi:MAG: hypothetical protein ACQEQO_11270, partial [Thermodesulfobacteriota bacterium]